MIFKILHIVPDDKFIDGAIDTFNQTSSINTYVSIDAVESFTYIKSYAAEVQILSKETLLPFILNGGYHLVAFHTLPRDKYELALQIPRHIKVLWLSWGYDLYSPVEKMPAILPIELYKPLTNKLINPREKVSPYKRLKRLIKRVIYYKKYRIAYLEEQRVIQDEIRMQKALLSRIDYMSTVLPSEYEMLSQLEGFHAEYFPFQYAFKDDFSFGDMYDNADKILLGNSATETNNHLDIIALLNQRNIKNECILPCSYGSSEYLQKLKQTLLGHQTNLHVIENFLPQAEYATLLCSCRVGIFGHLRQQAVGNILICMLHGSKVYLYRDSIAYKYFSKAGYYVYTIEDDLTDNHIALPLSKPEREQNKSLILSHFLQSRVIEKLDDKLRAIISISKMI